jgi:hypothetical protein
VSPVSNVPVGACAVSTSGGVMSKDPRLERSSRDLDGDGAPELVVVDRRACDASGNCYWNVYWRGADGSCDRYAGTLAGAALEVLPGRGDRGVSDVRGYWRLGRGERMLLQEYRFIRGGFEVREVLLCVRHADDRLTCSQER